MTGMPPFRQAFAKLMEHILPCKRSLGMWCVTLPKEDTLYGPLIFESSCHHTDPENFCMSTGCTPLIENLSFLLTDAGDSILIPVR